PGDEPARHAEDEVREPGGEDRDSERPEPVMAGADVVDGLADEERNQRRRAARDRRQGERDPDSAPVRTQELEQSAEELQLRLTLLFEVAWPAGWPGGSRSRRGRRVAGGRLELPTSRL